jgi:hypothetical protein
LRAAARLDGAAALDWCRVQQQQVVGDAGTAGGEHADQPLDRFGQPSAPLEQRILAGQLRKQMAELAPGGAQEAAVAGSLRR